MSDFARHMAAVATCFFGAWLAVGALFGHAWLVGERDGLRVDGGVIDVHYCAPADDPDRMPMGIGDLEGCSSEMYAQSEFRRQAGSWFGVGTHGTLLMGGFAAGLYFLFATIVAFGLEVQVAPWTQPLAFQLFDVESGCFWAHSHPGTQAAGAAIGSFVALGVAVGSAPGSLSVGPDVWRFAGGLVLATVAAGTLDPRVIAPDWVRRREPQLAAEPAPAAPPPETQEALEEQDAAESDTPDCVRCGRATNWLEAAARYRCVKCGLYQPLHPPGSRVDA